VRPTARQTNIPGSIFQSIRQRRAGAAAVDFADQDPRPHLRTGDGGLILDSASISIRRGDVLRLSYPARVRRKNPDRRANDDRGPYLAHSRRLQLYRELRAGNGKRLPGKFGRSLRQKSTWFVSTTAPS